MRSTAVSSKTSCVFASCTSTLNGDEPAARSPRGARTATANGPDVSWNRRALSSSSDPELSNPAEHRPATANKTKKDAASIRSPFHRAGSEAEKNDIPSDRAGNTFRKDVSRLPVATAFCDGLRDRHSTAMTMAGTTNASDPTTHMIAPAAAWSSSAENPKRRGVAEYEG